ncbi:MAG: adenylate/guanylate cyclase domain-containing protein [Microthrixaceae bacterium]
MLNRFFRIVVAVVNREGGWINKFEGDAALCLFGAPQVQPDHADRALRAAAALPRELAFDQDVLSAGIGVASGDVLAGFVGTPERFEYTVIGDVVNLASRLCDEAKHTPNGVLASVSTVKGSASDRGLGGGRRSVDPRAPQQGGGLHPAGQSAQAVLVERDPVRSEGRAQGSVGLHAEKFAPAQEQVRDELRSVGTVGPAVVACGHVGQLVHDRDCVPGSVTDPDRSLIASWRDVSSREGRSARAAVHRARRWVLWGTTVPTMRR